MPLPETASPMVPVSKNNVVVVEVDNLLVNWPTYVFDLTPDQPGPLKIILRLKNATKRAVEHDIYYMDESDSVKDQKKQETDMDVDTENLRSQKASIMLNLLPCVNRDCIYVSDSEEDSEDSDMTLTVDAIPVVLNGVVKDPSIPPKPKFLDIPWPPHRPRKAPQLISADELVTRFSTLMTHKASVKAVENHGDDM